MIVIALVYSFRALQSQADENTRKIVSQQVIGESRRSLRAALASKSCKALHDYLDKGSNTESDSLQAREQIEVWQKLRNSQFSESGQFESRISDSESTKADAIDKCTNLAASKGLKLISTLFECKSGFCSRLTCTFSGDLYAPSDC
jgi:hypothetical protein